MDMLKAAWNIYCEAARKDMHGERVEPGGYKGRRPPVFHSVSVWYCCFENLLSSDHLSDNTANTLDQIAEASRSGISNVKTRAYVTGSADFLI